MVAIATIVAMLLMSDQTGQVTTKNTAQKPFYPEYGFGNIYFFFSLYYLLILYVKCDIYI